MLVNSQTKSNNILFPLANGEFPAGMASQNKSNAGFFSHLPVLQEHVWFFEKVVFIHHVLLYVKTKIIFDFSSQILNEANDYYCMENSLYFNEFFILE